ncbi:hypothetical protein BC938DRAFT_472352 [Jimgerdemannia flammicorona]|uniref:tRNA-binding domain-containing protein n=1 Tax=Jimgerdemannia flammicorona TaxID=994334 RepID=A0A433Q693_9FUNG|nr:hypothetical protein BC938DRAFT_472352 [Jimgerdemannia flammicorona]
MPATIHLPKSANDIHLVHSHVTVKGLTIVEAAGAVAVLELDGQKIEGNNTVSKYLAAHATEKHLLGVSDVDHAEVDQWLTWTNTTLKVANKKELITELKFLDDHLVTRTYLIANRLTLSDLVVYANVHPNAKSLKPSTLPNLVRWFDLIQHIAVEGQRALAEKFEIIEFNLDDVPAPAPVATEVCEEHSWSKSSCLFMLPVRLLSSFYITLYSLRNQEKKDKIEKGKNAAVSTSKAVVSAAAPAAAATAEVPKAEKKEKTKGERRQPAPAPPVAEQSDLSRLDIRVGFIRSAKKHESADSLYVEEIDLGDGEGVYRTVVSGLVNHVPLEEMQERWCVCLANLKPAAMRGVKSEAMVLCATGADGKVELLTPVDTSKVKPGDKVYVEELEGEFQNYGLRWCWKFVVLYVVHTSQSSRAHCLFIRRGREGSEPQEEVLGERATGAQHQCRTTGALQGATIPDTRIVGGDRTREGG